MNLLDLQPSNTELQYYLEIFSCAYIYQVYIYVMLSAYFRYMLSITFYDSYSDIPVI